MRHVRRSILKRKSRKQSNKKRRHRSRRRVRRSKGGALGRLQCGEVLYAASYRPLSFGEKVKLRFCKDKEPALVERMSTFYR